MPHPRKTQKEGTGNCEIFGLFGVLDTLPFGSIVEVSSFQRELGPEDVSLLERCPHFRGCCVYIIRLGGRRGVMGIS